jgi:hypothetical protein
MAETFSRTELRKEQPFCCTVIDQKSEMRVLAEMAHASSFSETLKREWTNTGYYTIGNFHD